MAANIDNIYRAWQSELLKPASGIDIERVAELEVSARTHGVDLVEILASGALTASSFDEDRHPRGKDGKFIELLGWVNVDMGRGEQKRGKVMAITPNPNNPGEPTIRVEFEDHHGKPTGTPVNVKPNVISDATNAKARLDAQPAATNPRGTPIIEGGNEPGTSAGPVIDFQAEGIAWDPSNEEYVKFDGTPLTQDERRRKLLGERRHGDAPTVVGWNNTPPAKASAPGTDGAKPGGALDRWYQAQRKPGVPDTFGEDQAKDLSDKDLDAAIAEREQLNNSGVSSKSGVSDLFFLKKEKERRSSKKDAKITRKNYYKTPLADSDLVVGRNTFTTASTNTAGGVMRIKSINDDGTVTLSDPSGADVVIPRERAFYTVDDVEDD